MSPIGGGDARVLQVIEVGDRRGMGTTEDPARIVTVYRTLDGEFLAEVDPVRSRPDRLVGDLTAYLDKLRAWEKDPPEKLARNLAWNILQDLAEMLSRANSGGDW